MARLRHAVQNIIMILLIKISFDLAGDPESYSLSEERNFPRTICFFLKVFISLPFITFAICVLFHDPCPAKNKLKNNPASAPFLCFRVVTRGDFPDLITTNTLKHLKMCEKLGIVNFVIEIVTNQKMNVKKHPKVHETVVPEDYKTKSGALFKARNLQYCLDTNEINLDFNDWIVHLDEETSMTEDSLIGILNFVCEGKSHFGQGSCVYGNSRVENWMITLMDCCAFTMMDIAVYKFFIKLYNSTPAGCYVKFLVARHEAERSISFDFGPDLSVTEDVAFGLKASAAGYKFEWIEGIMNEMSSFNIEDCFNQRKRWMLGISKIIFSKSFLPLKSRMWSIYFLMTSFLSPLLMAMIRVFFYSHPSYAENVISYLFFLLICYFSAIIVLRNFSSEIYGISIFLIIPLVSIAFALNMTFIFFALGVAFLEMIFSNNSNKFFIVKKS